MKMFHVKHFGKIAGLSLTSAMLVLAIPVALQHFRQAAGALDLAAASQGSRIVVDRNGQLGRAALKWINHGHIVSGGSTLTMQVARLIEPQAGKSLAAKFEQIVRAVKIERRTDKTGVLDL